FAFLEKGPNPANMPSFASVVAFSQARAPEELALLRKPKPPGVPPVRFERSGYHAANERHAPGISNVRFVHLSDEKTLDVLACDMVNGKVLLLRPGERGAELRVVSDAVPNPAHAEVVDLDRDGVKDLLVANLGTMLPTEERAGSVAWLRGSHDGSFRPLVLAGKLGRVADVQAADFDGDGDLDLVVAEFGRLKVGGIVFMENRTTDYDKPLFVARALYPRPGSIHVPAADLNGDGRPDFVALISQ